MKFIFVATIIAAACSGVALAGELKQDQKTAAPVVKATVMNDAEMDKVTAGNASCSFCFVVNHGVGINNNASPSFNGVDNGFRGQAPRSANAGP